MSRSVIKRRTVILLVTLLFCSSLVSLFGNNPLWFGVSAVEAGQATFPDLVVSSISTWPASVCKDNLIMSHFDRGIG